jgi:lambda family phage portal protein
MGNPLDAVIGFFNPKAGATRVAYRKKMDLLNGVRTYEAASNGRLNAGWRASRGDADSVVIRDGQMLRDRSRDLVRNHPLAAKIVTTHADNLVGPGIMPRAKSADEKANKVLDELFDKWSKECHVEGTMNFSGLVYTMARMMVTDGEVFARRRRRLPSDGLSVPLQIQLLDSEFCDWNKSQLSNSSSGANSIVAGIEYDPIGRRRGYWMFPNNPRSGRTNYATNLTSAFVPGEDIAHMFEPQTNQSRGAPWMSSVMTEMQDLRDYEIAENIRKRAEACHVGVIIPGDDETDDPNIGLDETQDPENPDTSVQMRDIYGNPYERMEPGMFTVAHGGKDVKFNTPAISAGIEAYIRTRHRSIAAGARLPYELMTGDFSQANFASGKLGLLAYRLFVTDMQWNFIIPQVLEKIGAWFVQAAKESGKIPASLDVVWEWEPPEFQEINRLDEAQADLLEMRMGKRTPQEVIGKTGRNWKVVLSEIDEWFKAVDATGSALVFDSDPRKVSAQGQAQLSTQSKGVSNA